MNERLRQVPWWRWLLALVAIASVVYVTVAQDLAAAILAVVGIVAAVFTVWNPFEARPKPYLTMQPLHGEETTSLTLDAVLRPVDVDAVVEESLKTARALATSPGLIAMTQYAKPTEADHEQFEEALTAYADDVRAWVEGAEVWLRERASALVADVIQHNPTSVDATDARLHLFFPPGTTEYEETEPPKAPKRPAFPRRRSALAVLAGSTFADPSSLLTRHSFDLDGLHQEIIYAASFGAPTYKDMRDGGLEVTYGRWAIRHRESRATDEPLSLTIPAGKHRMHWEVRATNLPKHAEGTWTFSVRVETGTPIKTTGQLDAALQGKPEVSPADRQARLRELLRERQDNDRNDSSTTAR